MKIVCNPKAIWIMDLKKVDLLLWQSTSWLVRCLTLCCSTFSIRLLFYSYRLYREYVEALNIFNLCSRPLSASSSSLHCVRCYRVRDTRRKCGDVEFIPISGKKERTYRGHTLQATCASLYHTAPSIPVTQMQHYFMLCCTFKPTH